MNKNFITFFSIIGLLIYAGQSFPQGNWEQMLPPSPTSNQLVSLYFTDANIGWSVGEQGTLLKTTDGGDSWRIVEIPWLTYLLDIYFATESVGYIVGQDGLILKSNDSGENWTKQDISFTNNLHRVRFLD